MTTESRISRKEVEKLTLAQIVDDERVQSRFIMLFNARNRTIDGAAMYVQATESFLRVIQEDQNLQQCTPLSLYNAFLDMAYYGVTVSKQAQPLAYLLWNNINVGTKEAPKYEKRAHLAISPYGELAVRQSMRQIAHAETPVIVYEDDEYSGIYVKGGVKMVDYRKNMKSKNRKIVAAFMKIVKLDGSVDYVEMDMPQIERLKGYSARKNKGKANDLYTSNSGQIDEGFLLAKLVKHAFKAYPKVYNPLTKASFETEKPEVEETEDIYGLEDDQSEDTIPASSQEPTVEDADAQVIDQDESF